MEIEFENLVGVDVGIEMTFEHENKCGYSSTRLTPSLMTPSVIVNDIY